MSGTISPSTGCRYGVQRVCNALGLPRSTFYSSRVPTSREPSQKRGPKTSIDDAALLSAIQQDLAQSPFRGEGHRKVHARLRRHRSLRVGRNRVLRIMREHRLLSPHRGIPVAAKAHDGHIITEAPNQRWATDGSKVWTAQDGWIWLFVTVEHWNGECLGFHVTKVGNRFAAYEPVSQAITRVFGHCGPKAAHGVELRHDHGCQYLSDDFQHMARFHGLQPSFAFVGEPETNGVVERFFRTLKEQIIHGQHYENADALRNAVALFQETYNNHWELEKLGFLSPIQARLKLQSTSSLAA
jgi:putative transposase